ncbi:13612_t:CDS:2, partial [Racocetra persica]
DEEELLSEIEAFQIAIQQRLARIELPLCFPKQISVPKIENEEVEIFYLTAMKDVEETFTDIQTTMDLFDYQD